jgi:hypothetical protein
MGNEDLGDAKCHTFSYKISHTAYVHKEKELDILILAQRVYMKALLELQTCS